MLAGALWANRCPRETVQLLFGSILGINVELACLDIVLLGK